MTTRPMSALFRDEAVQAQRQRLHGEPLRITRSLTRATPILLQAEAAECGLACLAMVAGHHGRHADLAAWRARHAVSAKGATLGDLMRIAGRLHLSARPVRAEPEDLRELALPCVLHWDFNHFVVLVRCGARGAVLHDPATGRRDVPWPLLSRHFTGVALELAPTPDFEVRDERRPHRLRSLVGALPGLHGEVARIVMLASRCKAWRCWRRSICNGRSMPRCTTRARID